MKNNRKRKLVHASDAARAIHNVSIRQLKAFCLTVEMRSISDAAVRVGVCSAANCHSMTRLSLALGAELFTRNGNSIVPTDFSMKIYPEIKKMIAISDRILPIKND